MYEMRADIRYDVSPKQEEDDYEEDE